MDNFRKINVAICLHKSCLSVFEYFCMDNLFRDSNVSRKLLVLENVYVDDFLDFKFRVCTFDTNIIRICHIITWIINTSSWDNN